MNRASSTHGNVHYNRSFAHAAAVRLESLPLGATL
jgi:hypothetical protein